MIVLVIGASDRAIGQLRALAPAGVDVVIEPVAEPAWVLVATGKQRIDALAGTRLAPFRVLEVPEIASDLDPSALDALRTGFITMAGIGEPRPLISSIGLALVRPFVRRSAHAAALPDLKSLLDNPETRVARSDVPRPMPAGARLDDLLAASERKRAERFVAQAVRSDGRS